MGEDEQMGRRLARGGHAIHGVSVTLGVIAGCCLLILILSSTVDVVLRLTQGTGMPGVVSYGEVLLTVLAFLALGYTQRQGEHVSVDALVIRMPPRVAAAVEAVGILVIAALVAWLVIVSGQVAYEAYLDGERSRGLVRLPTWPGRAAVTVGSTALLLELGWRVLVLILVALDRVAHDVTGPTSETRNSVDSQVL